MRCENNGHEVTVEKRGDNLSYTGDFEIRGKGENFILVRKKYVSDCSRCTYRSNVYWWKLERVPVDNIEFTDKV